MRARVFASVVLAGLLGCARARPAPPPPVFPLETVWTAALDAALDPPLARDDQRLFVTTRDGKQVALRLEDGVTAWTAPVPGRVSAVAGSVVVRAPEGRLTSLQPRAGGERWAIESEVPGELPAVIDGDTIFVAGQGMAAFETSTGRLLWRASEDAVVTSLPVREGPRIVAGEADGTLRARDRVTGVTVWTFKTKEGLRAPAFTDRGDIFLGTTDRRLLRLRSGKGKPSWSWRTGADVTTPAAVAGSLALFTSFDATLYAVQRGSGKLAWRAGLPSRPLSGPLVVGTTALVACHESEIVGFSLRDGKPAGNLKVGAEIRTPPLLHRGRLYLGLRDRRVIALQVASPGAEP